MNPPKFKIGDTVDCEVCMGWVSKIFVSLDGGDTLSYVYSVKDAETDVEWLAHEEEMTGV